MQIRKLSTALLLLFLSILFYSCSDNSPTGNSSLNITNENIELNPSGVAPLTAQIDLETDIETSVMLRVAGINGPESYITHNFNRLSQSHTIPILGLYGGTANTVELSFFDRDGNEVGSKTYEIETQPLLSDLPEIEINTANRSQMAEGLTLVSYFGHDGNSNPQRPFMFDSYGDIRWYLDFRSSSDLNNLFYDDGIERLQNGNFYFGDGSTNKIYEVDMLGNVIESWDMPGYGFHHEVSEKPNGNFLVTVNKQDISTVEDHIIEIDRESKNIINVWDLNESLDNERRTWETDLADLSVDWFHANAVEYDESDNTIVVSGRTQGTVKLTENNEVVWILAPHKGWETSGNGTDLNQFLLQPLNAGGQPITDEAVQSGDSQHPDFDWAWYQHAPQVLEDGHLLLFDNGDNRNYGSSQLYSRAVEYDIDKENMTIQQVWSYGKERGRELYSRIVSDVDYYPQSDHVFFSPGAINFGGAVYGKAIEIDHSTKQVLFEATITPPTAVFGITLHRTERLPIYPE